MLNLKYDAIDYETAESDEREATITLKTESGQSITLHIQQGQPYDDTYFPEYPYGDGSLLVLPYYKGSDGADNPFIPNEEQKKFLTDWENVKNVTLYYNHGATTQVPTPWNLENSQIAIQSSIGSDVLKADGWEMAFSTIGYDNPGRNYFGLYNRELGILRIFFYCDKDVTGTGNHFYFHVQMGDQRNRESFYGTLPFGVPMNHHTPGDKADVIVAMNAAALKVCTLSKHYHDHAIVIVDTDALTDKDLEKALYKTDNPFTELAIPETVQIVPVALTTLTKEALKETGMDNKSILKCRNMFALGLIYWLFDEPMEKAIHLLEDKFKNHRTEVNL